MTIPLNQGQTAAGEAFFAFLFNDDEKEMIISGPGGVGKSHLISALIDNIMPRYFKMCDLMGLKPKYDGVEMTATTNKAAEVLAISTSRPTSTVHSFLNLKVQEDYKTGKTKLTKNNNTWKVHQDKIVIVDEASTTDTELINMLHEGTHNCKIVYVGDHCQLAPVTEQISPIYRQNLPFYELTEQMRTAVPELQSLNDQLRATVETGNFQPIQIVPGLIDWLDDDQMQAEIAQTFTHQTHSSRILAYTNDRVNQYNEHIRDLRHLPNHYTVGELLINNSAISLKTGEGNRALMVSVEAELEIIDLAPHNTIVNVAPNADLEVCYATVRLSRGTVFDKVALPVDRTHYLELIRYFQKTKNWNRYFYMKQNFPDFRPRDASTVHKAQGSTYDTVFIDLGNISTCHNPNQVARMLYVAFSRARHRVFLYGQLAEKYGGLTY